MQRKSTIEIIQKEEMACRLQRRISLRRKLHILRKSAKRTSVAKSTVLFKLKLMLEAVKREYDNLIATRREYLKLLKHFQEPKEVKVEKLGAGRFWVRISTEKGGDTLVAILEAFDEMCLNVEQARVSCNDDFSMEAVAVAEEQTLDVRNITEALLKAIGKPTICGENDSEKIETLCKLTTL